jgi:zinc transporter, ZIP family
VPLNVWTVTIAAFVTAIATGAGALPFLWRRTMPTRWLGMSNAIAAGFMLSASVALFWQGADRGVWRVVAGAAAGIVVIWLGRRLIGDHEHVAFGVLRGAEAWRALVVIAIFTVHSFSEGVGVGVSYGDGQRLGVLITAAIAIHNIPEGLAISLVMVPQGASVRSAAWWSVFSSLPQPLVAAPAFLFVESFRQFLPAGLGFAAGAMTWVVLRELLPEARAEAPARLVAAALGLSFAGFLALQLAFLGT